MLKKLIFVAFLVIISHPVMCQVVSVTNSTNTVRITNADGSFDIAFKRGAKVVAPVTGNLVYFIDRKGKSYPIDYSTITSPVTVSKIALAATLKNYINP